MFPPYDDELRFPELEERILEFWETSGAFERTQQQRLAEQAPWFNFYEGPPTANGAPGIHHMMARTIKDTVCRYKTMRGYYVRRQAGWDTHGLPVEIAASRELGLLTRDAIIAYGIDRFNRYCRELVERHITMPGGWRYLTRRMGFWVDLDAAYITCSNEYIESVWWSLKQLFDRGLIVKGFKVVPQSPTIETPLSSHELSLGYRTVRDPSVYLMVAVRTPSHPALADAYLLVWTTTPWTLFGNVALAVHPEIEYVVVSARPKKDPNAPPKRFVLAAARLEVLTKEWDVTEQVRLRGQELVGTRYDQIFDDIPLDLERYPNALCVLPGDFVSTEEGTGIVHIAPAFGQDDFELMEKFDLPMPVPVTPNGHFTEQVRNFAGRAIKTFTYPDGSIEEGADRDIVAALKAAGKVLKATFDYEHSYPHCWRTGNPIMYYARESWFIRSPLYRDRMIELNRTIQWQPPEIGAGRFGNWLEEVKDWALSRDRFWGTPLPIWQSDDGDAFAVGSIAELMEGFIEQPGGTRVPVAAVAEQLDLHRPFVDRIIFERNGKIYRRVPDVIDVWYDSGAMPFAQFHYPFENQELFERSFPADFIAEGIDQTRGWFYTLHNIATALFDRPAFRSVVVNELVLDSAGQKMSKSRGNTVDPFVMMERYGADAVRWYMVAANPPWKPLRFNENEIVSTVLADFFRALTNTYTFFALYANIDGFSPEDPLVPYAERPEIDRWILSALHTLRTRYCEEMDRYEITRAARLVQDFVWRDLSNWYVRRNRRRFWKGQHDQDKRAAYQTLYEVLRTVSLLIAPIAPFLAEDLYQRLRRDSDPISVHMERIAPGDPSFHDPVLERRMELAQQVVYLARSLREKARIRTRQPLRRIMIPPVSAEQRRDIEHVATLICEEINVKAIEFLDDDTAIVHRIAKPNFRSLGKRFGKDVQRVAACIRSLDQQQIRKLQSEGQLLLRDGDLEALITLDDVEILSQDIEGWLVASEGNVTVALDTEITAELRAEGIARELVNRIQNLRKSSGFEVTDRIRLWVEAPAEIHAALERLRHYVMEETLAVELHLERLGERGIPVELDGTTVRIAVERVPVH
ncbi:MAG: isoleucine--tRNA ligase [Bacteroidota bacterium]|nr:isoleucine--tRNA ligase [Candidatus Kapabacteria bacterium]MCS7302820.1 isoleucine--tRNA ligase [Candidatus Kapabacteria bacterium]MCX7936950.1 isoleucine--tRNA ligase [Chlorobiota bacterium]MDW8075590.1 isoleucine--tRNA ligase [Bacteroidota bacterium]MDW8272093.1 isoleucine--tRNA ligase [Bacteroidota bacterium]